MMIEDEMLAMELRGIRLEISALRNEFATIREDTAVLKQQGLENQRRLDKINGSVARHEMAINDIRLAQATEAGASLARDNTLLTKSGARSFGLFVDIVKGAVFLVGIVIAIQVTT